MSEKNLAKARGLNSIADPSSFRGTSRRRKPVESQPKIEQEALTNSSAGEKPEAKVELNEIKEVDKSSDTDKKFFGLGERTRSNPESVKAKSSEEISEAKAEGVIDLRPAAPKHNAPMPAQAEDEQPRAFRRKEASAVDDSERVQKEMSIPIPVHDSLAQTGYNVTDLLRRAYRNHSEEVRAGEYLRSMHRGRRRVRLSMAPDDYARLDKLGRSRGWNRSEVVTVLLEAELANEEYKK